MIKRKNGKAVRLVSSGNKLSLVSVRKGDLGISELRNGVPMTSAPFYAADDAVKLFDGKTLVQVRGNLFVVG